MFLSNLSIKRPVFATVLMLALVTLGVFSYRRLAVDMFPDIEIPVITVVTLFPGASPETVEREVTKKLEQAVNPIAGVKHVYSTSREGVSTVIVEFDLESKINDVSQDARAKIAAIRNELPQSIEEPVIQKMDIGGMAIVSLAVRSGQLTPRELTTLVDRKVKRRLENLPGVGKIDLVGDTKREVSVDLDPARMDALGLGVDEVTGGLAGENVNTPLGRMDRGGQEVPVRIAGKPRDVSGFRSMVVAQRGGVPVTLGQVAEIRDGVEEQRKLALINGVPAIVIDVYKQSKANTVGVVEAVNKEIARLRTELPPSVEIQLVRDGSVMIKDSVHDVTNTLILGGLLTVLIVFCFLNSWRSTVITGLTLPISVLSSFIAMYFLGMTLNVMTLMALSLAIGLLIDDAIVVRENIVRHLEHGQDHVTAARDGTSEIGLAVLATSMSIIAVFVPVAFMKGVIGRFFFQFGMTVAFAVLVSLFVSFTLDPMLSSRWVDPDVERTGNRHLVARALDRFNGWFDRMADRYKAVVGWALDHRKTVALLATAAFALGVMAFGMLASEFMAPDDQAEFQIKFKTAPDASFEETRGRVEAVLRALREMPEVQHTYASIGAGDTGTVRDARVYVKLVEKGKRSKHATVLAAEARRRIAGIAGILPSVEMQSDEFSEKPIMVSIRGDDIPLLKKYAAQLKEAVYRIPGVVDLELTLELDLPEYQLVVNRERAADVGLTTPAIARTVGALVGGQAVTTYEDEEGEAVDVRVRLPLAMRRDVSQIGDLRLAVPRGPGAAPALIPLSDLVKAERSSTPSEISRRDLSREVLLSANLDGVPLGTALERIRAAAAKIDMAPGYKIFYPGEAERMEESFANMFEALFLAVIFVYLILAAQFESFIDPLSIMLSLPLSIVGMAGALLLAGDTLGVMAFIGLILLMGLVTKNAILLVDYTKVLRRQGVDRRTALVTAGRTRLRPILMTTLAMIFGMVPLALGIGQGAEMRAPMGRAVIGGLITSTVLTLVVVPVVYTLFDDFAGWIHRRWSKANALEQDARVHARPAARIALGLLLAGALAFPARAEGPAAAPAVRVLTLEEAVRIAVEKNRDVEKARVYREWVQGKYVEERAGALPSVSANAAALATRDDAVARLSNGFQPANQTTLDLGVSLHQTLFAWGQVGAAIRAAKQGIASAEDQLDHFRQAAIRDVTEAFYDVVFTRELLAIARKTLDQRRRQLAEAEQRHALGTATDYDVLAARVALENQEPEVIRAEGLVVIARDRLRLVLAEPAELDAAGSLEAQPGDVPALEEAFQAALERRPDLRGLTRTVDVRRELVRIVNAGDKPRLDLRASAGYRWLESGPGASGNRADGQNWTAGVFLTFPFFDGLATRGRVQQARSDVTTAELDVARAQDGIRFEVRTALEQARAAGQIVRALGGTVEQARRLLAMAEKGQELGVKTRLEVDDALVNLRAAEANLARARRDYLVSMTNLSYVQGML